MNVLHLNGRASPPPPEPAIDEAFRNLAVDLYLAKKAQQILELRDRARFLDFGAGDLTEALRHVYLSGWQSCHEFRRELARLLEERTEEELAQLCKQRPAYGPVIEAYREGRL